MSKDPSSSASPSIPERLFGKDGIFGTFSDRNRLARLENCEQLQKALDSCEGAQRDAIASRQHNSWGRGSSDNVQLSETDLDKAQSQSIERLQNIRGGMKIARFYEWGIENPNATAAIGLMREKQNITEKRTMHPKSVSSNVDKEDPTVIDLSGKENKANVTSRAPCSMERHAVWACRSLAVGCAPDLVDLKKCFKDNLGTTNPPSNHYEDASVDREGPSTNNEGCKWSQRKLGKCVINEVDLLQKRMNE
jgi:hypothetical protein